MITIIIHGYNFIFNSYFKINVKSEKLQKLRDDTVNFLSKYYNVKRNKVIVVFDGYNTLELSESRYVLQNIEIIYSKKDEKADDVIIRLAKGCENSIVVTNDNEIRRSVEGINCSCMSPEEFKILAGNIINGDYSDIALHRAEEEGGRDGDASNRKKKGNPHRLSKKERLKIKKIKKI